MNRMEEIDRKLCLDDYELWKVNAYPEGHSRTVNILLFPVYEIHWNVKSIINILLKSAF